MTTAATGSVRLWEVGYDGSFYFEPEERKGKPEWVALPAAQHAAREKVVEAAKVAVSRYEAAGLTSEPMRALAAALTAALAWGRG